MTIRCTWCEKLWKWDYCQDAVVGLDCTTFVCLDKPEFQLDLFICSCGGSLCITIEEPKGSTLFDPCEEI